MAIITDVARLIDDPSEFLAGAGTRRTGFAGMAGYAVGVFSLFVFLRMFSAVPPGVYSFLNVLLAVLAVNFVFAGAIHLFLEATGAGGGKALTLFFLFGVTELVWMVLIPLGLLANLDLLGPGTDLTVCFLGMIAARVSLMRRLYSISRNKALLALSLPYAAIAAGSFLLAVYSILWLVWAVS